MANKLIFFKIATFHTTASIEILEIERETKTLYVLNNGGRVKKDSFDKGGCCHVRSGNTWASLVGYYYFYSEEKYQELYNRYKTEVKKEITPQLTEIFKKYDVELIKECFNEILGGESSGK